MRNHTAARRSHAVNPLYLFFAIPMAVVFQLIQLPGSMAGQMNLAASQPISMFVILFMVCGALLGVLAFLLHHRVRASHPLVLPSVLLLLLGEALLLWCEGNGFQPTWAFNVACLLVGFGFILVLLLWGFAFSLLEPGYMFSMVALSMAVAGVLEIGFSFLPWQEGMGMGVMVLIALSACPLEYLFSARSDECDAAWSSGDDAGAGAQKKAPGSVRRFLNAEWRPLCGALLCFIFYACCWGTLLGSGAEALNGSGKWYLGMAYGFIFGGLVLFVVARLVAAKAPTSFSRFAALLPMIIVALLLIDWFMVRMDKDALGAYSDLLTGCVTSMFFITIWSTVSSFSHRHGRPMLWFCLTGSIVCVTIAVFAGLADVFGANAEYILPILGIVYLMLSTFDFRGEKDRAAQERQGAPLQEKERDAGLSEVVSAYRLSPREGDVLELLAQGYTADYLCEVLGISLNTVKSYKRHIYRKLDIHTQDELISLMARQGGKPDSDEEPGSNAGPVDR